MQNIAGAIWLECAEGPSLQDLPGAFHIPGVGSASGRTQLDMALEGLAGPFGFRCFKLIRLSLRVDMKICHEEF